MTDELAGKTSIVTGANSGVGYYTALGLAKMGAEVVMLCRDKTRGQAALEAIKAESGNTGISLILADFGSFKQVRAAAAEFLSGHKKLHILVNNAGAINGKRIETADGNEQTFQANHLSPFLLTNLLLPVIKQSVPARIVNVSSMAHGAGHINFDDLMARSKYSEFGAYAQSKLANILFTIRLARDLEGSGVTANSVHPGGINSNFGKSGGSMFRAMYKYFGFLMDSSEKGARTSLYAAASPETAAITGKYFDNCRIKTPSKEAQNMGIADRLWDVSLKLTGLATEK